jgi:hypothetical protein
MSVLFIKYHPGYQIQKNEMGETCSVYGGEAHDGFWWGDLSERYQLQDRGPDEKIILKWIYKSRMGCMD